MSTIVKLADALVAALNASSFSMPVVATRAYVPVYRLDTQSNLAVTVIPSELSLTPLTRGKNQGEYVLDLAVQKKLATQDQSEIDALMRLTEEIGDAIFRQRLESPAAMCVALANRPIYSREHLDEKRLFTSILSATFLLAR